MPSLPTPNPVGVIPMHCIDLKLVAITRSNSTTLLLSLPRELRIKIFEIVLDRGGVENNYVLLETAHPRNRPLPGRWLWLNSDSVPEDKVDVDDDLLQVYFGRELDLHFFRTCRQIWYEAYRVLLENHFISIDHIEGFFRYQYHLSIKRLGMTVRLPHRSIEWEAKAWLWFCKVAADDMSLTQLSLSVMLDYIPQITLRTMWLKPLFRVRGLKLFDIHIQVQGGACDLSDLELIIAANMLGPRMEFEELDEERSQVLSHFCRNNLYFDEFPLYEHR